MTTIADSSEWHALREHFYHVNSEHMYNWFLADSDRFSAFSIPFHDLLLDYSKNRLTLETRNLLIKLAHKANLKDKINGLFSGHSLNFTENRPALHTALRSKDNAPTLVDGHDIIPEIKKALTKMADFTKTLRSGNWRGATGKKIETIVNVGIGGSHLGPLMATEALSDFSHEHLRCFFVANIDGVHLNQILKKINPETTLFIISSKSFTTLETITNARALRDWLLLKLEDSLDCAKSSKEELINRHFVAVTAVPERAIEFGIRQENIFPIWEWVGGRYSVWSAIGLPLALMIGMENFQAFLDGAYAMDCHFRTADFSTNIPVILGLLGIWYINFFDARSHAIIPYTQHLNYFRQHLQQLDMESNGKRTSSHGDWLPYTTGPALWGEQGCNGQHAFHQLLHQGQQCIPVDFILVGKSSQHFEKHHDILVASGLSQAKALMQGKSYEEAYAELIAKGLSKENASFLAKHKTIPGNRPSNTLFIKEINPYNLGMLLALYEHKIFVQGAIWDINSFDQWGVELGKELLPNILNSMSNEILSNVSQDGSTIGLIQHYRKVKEPS